MADGRSFRMKIDGCTDGIDNERQLTYHKLSLIIMIPALFTLFASRGSQGTDI